MHLNSAYMAKVRYMETPNASLFTQKKYNSDSFSIERNMFLVTVFLTQRKSVRFIIKSKTVTTIIFLSIWKESEMCNDFKLIISISSARCVYCAMRASTLHNDRLENSYRSLFLLHWFPVINPPLKIPKDASPSDDCTHDRCAFNLAQNIY